MFIAVRVICDRVSGKSKGYGFVHFDSEAAASTALNQMNGQVREFYFNSHSYFTSYQITIPIN